MGSKLRSKRRIGENVGDLHPPIGEAKRHSANPDPKRSGATLHVDPSLTAEPKPSREDIAAKSWIETTAATYGAENPRASVDKKRHWTVRIGNAKLGAGLSDESVRARDTEAVAELFDLRSAVTVEFSPKGLGEQSWKLWALIDAITNGQREVVKAVMREDHGHPDDCQECSALLHKRNSKGNDDAGISPETHAYHVVSRSVSEWAARQKRWTSSQRESWRGPSGALMAAASKSAAEKTRGWLRSSSYEEAPPWFKSSSCAIPEPAFSLEMIGRDAFLEMKLEEGRGVPPMRVQVFARGAAEWADLRKIINRADRYKRRAARLTWDQGRKRWLLRIAFSRPRPALRPGTGRLVVIPCVRSFVRMFTDDAKAPAQLDCASVLAFKSGVDARRAKIRTHLPHVGHGSRGHGAARRFRLYRDIAQAEHNWVKTWCQQQAAHVAKTAMDRGVAEVVVSDFTTQRIIIPDRAVERIVRRFPFGMLKDATVWACAKAGLKCRAETVRRGCPSCGGKLETADGTSVCACGVEGDADFVAAWRFHQDLAADNVERARIDKAYNQHIEDLKRFLREAKKLAQESEDANGK